jgi:hypothetical protein
LVIGHDGDRVVLDAGRLAVVNWLGRFRWRRYAAFDRWARWRFAAGRSADREQREELET